MPGPAPPFRSRHREDQETGRRPNPASGHAPGAVQQQSRWVDRATGPGGLAAGAARPHRTGLGGPGPGER